MERKAALDHMALWVCLIMLLGMTIFLVVRVVGRAEQVKINKPANDIVETQDGAFFTEEERFIKVDTGSVCGHNATVYADSITGVMYIFVGGYGSFCPLYNTDGTLMIYDPAPEEVDVNA